MLSTLRLAMKQLIFDGRGLEARLEKKTRAAGYLNGKPTQNYSKQQTEKVRQKLLNGFEK